MAWGWWDIAHNAASAASLMTNVGFGVAKASTRFGFSIARSIVGLAPVPFLKTSLDHLENFSLLPILLGESIASTSFNAASIALSNFSEANDSEASFSLTSFVTLVRNEWVEMDAAGRSVVEVARAVATWAAIQGFTREWSENRWLQSMSELSMRDILAADSSGPCGPSLSSGPGNDAHQDGVRQISVTEDVIIPEGDDRSQVVSADIGQKSLRSATARSKQPNGKTESGHATTSEKDARGNIVPSRSNYEVWHTLRRLSKIVLAGYGGAGLLFFGAPLQPNEVISQIRKLPRTDNTQRSEENEAMSTEEETLLNTLERAEVEDRNETRLPAAANPIAPGMNHPDTPIPPSSYSWWNVLLGKHDRDIFEGFAFTQPEEDERKIIRSPSSASVLSARSWSSAQSPNHTTTPSQAFAGLNNIVHSDSVNNEGYFAEKPSSSGSKREGMRTRHSAVFGDTKHFPRFWVLTDHGRRQVVLVVRGTMSFNELAADLACEPAPFTPATVSTPAATQATVDVCEAESISSPEPTTCQSHSSQPDYFPLRRSASVVEIANEMRKEEEDKRGKSKEQSPFHPQQQQQQTPEDDAAANTSPPYEVHGGMLLLARAMGCKGKPVHDAVLAAFLKNPHYELILCGHSLGAGVATLLALMWADPKTCRTVPSSGLPPERRVSVYCFAPPCVTSASLSRLCRNLITSFVYSFDAVSRLSLGSMRDMREAAFWLCEGQGEAGTVGLLRRALKGKLGFGDVAENTEEEKKWFIAVRKTLEAKMPFTHLFPPGRLWWAVRDESLHPSHQSGAEISGGLRLFEVHHVEQVFGQIEFKGDMLSSHLPHQYDKALSELVL